jgi:hypothetical protein
MKRLDAVNDNNVGKQIARTRQIWQPRIVRLCCPSRADELERLPANSAIEQMLSDHQAIREQARVPAKVMRRL